ncbi:MAG: hypothetical protein J0I54_17790 [Bosea sp.]|mgnify:CR=1 FL=1|uniref:hypothetical protein n=1 Tax=unclassified Bosea (in: a-proteobacteria) TaxID=2653178 RepID=UPI00096781DA|nr:MULTISPECIES: hypothetical protein [unclassified Bosea (in: a-proteobacteria)]MBN9458486.1 hypothetical protein [Bosea sp. (in: a-proteobacteria)]OJV06812.1 MAG: hypothetical protein BGO20_00155 [Bosea sp. 67-29]
MSRHPVEEEMRRGVSLSLTNAVFSKLIKMGRQLGKTPQRMAQELFDEAYAARCMGKSAAQQVAAAGAMADALEEDLQQQLAEARAQLARMEARYEEQFAGRDRALDQLVKAQDLAIEIGKDRDTAKAAAKEAMDQVKRMEGVIAGKDRMLLDQADEIRKMREAAKGQLVVVNQASEILKREAQPAEEPAWAQPSSASQLRAIRAMKAAGNSPAAIARQLAVSIETIKAALA